MRTVRAVQAWYARWLGRTIGIGFDAEVAANLGESNLDRPSADEPAQDIERVCVKISAQKGLRLEFTGDVANQHIANGNKAARMIPDGSVGHDLDQTFATTIPAGYSVAAPAGLAVGKTFDKCWLPLADNPRPSHRAAWAAWSWVK